MSKACGLASTWYFQALPSADNISTQFLKYFQNERINACSSKTKGATFIAAILNSGLLLLWLPIPENT